MNILILGSGGREHAFAQKIELSKLSKKLFIAPGNSGTEKTGKNLNISYNDFPSIKKAVLQYGINMVVVGPEEPLVNGIHDYFLADSALKDVIVIGPQTMAAQLEGSKNFAKEFLNRHNIPTAAHKTFNKSQISDANNFLERRFASFSKRSYWKDRERQIFKFSQRWRSMRAKNQKQKPRVF